MNEFLSNFSTYTKTQCYNINNNDKYDITKTSYNNNNNNHSNNDNNNNVNGAPMTRFWICFYPNIRLHIQLIAYRESQ